MAGKIDAKAKLESFYQLLVRTLTGPASHSWVLRVLGREFVAPSPALAALRDKELLPKIQRAFGDWQKGDVPATWAAPDLLQALTGYTPETDVETGVKAFVEWYRGFYSG